MPTVFKQGKYRAFFYAQDCDEPVHVHVEHEANRCKYWIDPLKMAKSGGFKAHELREIEKMLKENLEVITKKWADFCP